MAVQTLAALPPHQALGRYRIVKKIAAGGFSAVYLGTDSEGQAVAIKEYLPLGLAQREPGQCVVQVAPEQASLYREGLRLFMDEARVLAAIQHANVVRVLDFFSAHETAYLVMDYERGQSLQQHLQQRRQQGGKPLVSEQALRSLFGQVTDALREVHTHKLLHLDIKPANIYLRANGTPVLLDFGAARQTLHADLTYLHTMYTPGFAAPEMIARRELGPWTDIYSIGAALFSCMLGVAPQSALERQRDDRMPHYFQALGSLYTPALMHLMEACMQLDPMLRPQSVFALQKLLRASSDEIKTSDNEHR
jgi:serine/threonine protein kinase